MEGATPTARWVSLPARHLAVLLTERTEPLQPHRLAVVSEDSADPVEQATQPGMAAADPLACLAVEVAAVVQQPTTSATPALAALGVTGRLKSGSYELRDLQPDDKHRSLLCHGAAWWIA